MARFALIVGTTHLEVRHTPRCRAVQFHGFLDGLEQARRAWNLDAPVILTGDWNTNSFARGGLLPSARGFLRIVGTEPARLERQLARPIPHEPLFRELAQAGYAIEPFNDFLPTVSQDLGVVEDLSLLPRTLARWISHRFGLAGRVLRMRLDSIAAKGVESAGPPCTVSGLFAQGRPVSGSRGHRRGRTGGVGGERCPSRKAVLYPGSPRSYPPPLNELRKTPD